MSQDRDTNLALFIDFDNVALGARDARQRFDVNLLLQRVLEKGKIIVKRAYADWHYYKEHMQSLHEAAIELIEIPMPRISGKNSADIKLVVDAMDLCYSKDHIDTFVIISGDSDFSPLVSKLRENNKRVIGIGVKNSSSKLLINNCDEFMFYDDIYRNAVGQTKRSVTNVPDDKRDLFDFLVTTVQGLLQESRGVLYSSLVKDTMTRKQPDFNERNYGYSNFGELLEEARRLGLLVVERDARAGGTWVIQGLGEGNTAEPAHASAGNGSSRSARRRRSRRGGRSSDTDRGAEEKPAEVQPAEGKSAEKKSVGEKVAPKADPVLGTPAETNQGRVGQAKAIDHIETKKKTGKKAPARKTVTKKATTRKTTAKKTSARKTTVRQGLSKTAEEKSPATKKTTKKTVKKATKKIVKKTAKKTTKKAAKKTTKKPSPKVSKKS